MIIVKSKIVVAAASALGLLAAVSPAKAGVVATVTNNSNLIFTTGPQVLLATAGFNMNAGESFLITFAAECAVDAPAGNTSAWTDIDIQLLNVLGTVVNTFSPTAGSLDAFCSSNGTAGFDGWTTASMTLTHTFASPGTFSVRVVGRLNGGATGGWYGDRSLVVWR